MKLLVFHKASRYFIELLGIPAGFLVFNKGFVVFRKWLLEASCLFICTSRRSYIVLVGATGWDAQDQTGHGDGGRPSRGLPDIHS